MGNFSRDHLCDVLCTGVVRAHAGGGLGCSGGAGAGVVWSCQSTSVEPKISPAPFCLHSHYVGCCHECWSVGTLDTLCMYIQGFFEQ